MGALYEYLIGGDDESALRLRQVWTIARLQVGACSFPSAVSGLLLALFPSVIFFGHVRSNDPVQKL